MEGPKFSTENERLLEIAAQFARQGPVRSAVPLGNGNINSTFLVTAAGGEQFVLQRINAQVFHQPEQVIHNIVALNEHLSHQSAERSRRWETPHILPTHQGQHYWIDAAGEYWRAISFIAGAHVLERVESVAQAKEVGFALAMFHRLIATLSADKLTDTLKGFHITPLYLAAYETVRRDWEMEQGADSWARSLSPTLAEHVHDCFGFIEQRQQWAHVLEQAKASGHLCLRPIHGDPKVNNILLDDSGLAIGLVDLDTLKPGLIHYDIGDCLRSGCNRLGEETEDWQRVVFDLDLAEAMLQGYLALAQDFLTETDYDYLYDAIRLIAFELGLRFFTDYLAGNVYFKVKHPTHNLRRALVQFKLTESIEAQSNSIRAMIQSLRP